MQFRFGLLLLSLVTALAAKDATVTLRTVELTADADANQDSAAAVDLVFVYDRAQAAALPKNGPDWFGQKRALAERLGADLDIVSLEVPPGTVVPSVPLPERHRRAVAVVVYANYLAHGGQAPLDISRLRHAVVRLRATTREAAERAAPQPR